MTDSKNMKNSVGSATAIPKGRFGVRSVGIMLFCDWFMVGHSRSYVGTACAFLGCRRCPPPGGLWPKSTIFCTRNQTSGWVTRFCIPLSPWQPMRPTWFIRYWSVIFYSPHAEFQYGFSNPVGTLQTLANITHMVSVLMGAVTVGAAYYFGYILSNRWTAVLNAALVLFSFPLIY